MKRSIPKIAIIAFLLIWIPSSFAGLYWETHMKMTGVPGGQDKDETTKTYMTEDSMRVDSSDGIMIFRLKDGVIYTIDTVKKTYSEMQLDNMFQGKDGESSKKAQEMMASMAQSMEVKKTSETKKISGYNCTKYIVSIMGMETEQWVTEDIKEFNKLRIAMRAYSEKYKSNPLVQSVVGNASFEDIKGCPIYSSSQFGNMKTENKVIKVEVKKIDDDLFKVPSGYAKIESSFQN